jgi:ornithine--oxo-acid transaminase
VAKALSGGFIPVGATLTKGWIFGKVYGSMDQVLVHDSTFGANAAAMAAGLATLAVIEDEALVENAERTGRLLRDALAAMIEQYELPAEVRGRGLMVGLEFAKPRSWRLRTHWAILQSPRQGLFAQAVVMAVFAPPCSHAGRWRSSRSNRAAAAAADGRRGRSCLVPRRIHRRDG